MAYETGTAIDAEDLLTKLHDFALANGWTIAKKTATLLFLNKGICHVAIEKSTYAYTDYQDALGVGLGKTDTEFKMALATSLDAGRTTYWGHPGSLVTSNNNTAQSCVNDLAGSIDEYHFFTDAASTYIMCAVRTNIDHWRHFGFGLVAKGDFTHGGVAFLHGQAGYFYRHSSSTSQTTPFCYYNSASSHQFPFARPLGTFYEVRSNQPQLYAPDALPISASWPAMTNALLRTLNHEDKPPTQYPSTANKDGTWLNPMQGAPFSQVFGNVPLFTAPCFIRSTALSKSCYVGDFPNFRVLNMESLLSGDEISLGPDTWVVFSIGRQTPWGTQTDLGFQYSTGHYGVAYKKIV